MVQRPGFSIESRSGYWSGFTNAACTPALASNGKNTCQTKKYSRESILLQLQLCWAGHVTRMEDVHMPKAVFLCELQERKRDRGAPRKHHKDQLKRQHDGGISHQSWQQEASDRDSWCLSVRKASCKFEAYRHEAAKEECWRQKEQAASQSSSAQTFVCPKCSRVCTSRAGLCSHQ